MASGGEALVLRAALYDMPLGCLVVSGRQVLPIAVVPAAISYVVLGDKLSKSTWSPHPSLPVTLAVDIAAAVVGAGLLRMVLYDIRNGSARGSYGCMLVVRQGSNE